MEEPETGSVEPGERAPRRAKEAISPAMPPLPVSVVTRGRRGSYTELDGRQDQVAFIKLVYVSLWFFVIGFHVTQDDLRLSLELGTTINF